MTLAYRMHDKQWTHQGHPVTAPGKKKQESKREPAHDAWRAKPAQKIDSRTLVHTVGGRVSSPWGPTRDVAHPPVNAERCGSEANGRQSGPGGERNNNIGRRAHRSDRCVCSLTRQPCTCATQCSHLIYLQECTSQSRIHLVFGFGAPGWGA